MYGCYSYRIFPKEARGFVSPATNRTVYIENPELKKEFSILKRSGICNISADSNEAVRVQLVKMHDHFVCGNPLVGWLILLGQVPAYLPDKHLYSFNEIRNGDTLHLQYELFVVKRCWFWDMFSLKKNFNNAAATSLAAQYYNPNLIPTAKQ